jgi:two-component system, cell cycle response regulator
MREAKMSANLLYVTNNANRAEAFKAICADENYALTVCATANAGDSKNFDLIFSDAVTVAQLKHAANKTPVVAIFDIADPSETNSALACAALDVLAFPFNAIEAASRLRCLSRLFMLQNELLVRQTKPVQSAKELPILVLGSASATQTIKSNLGTNFTVECAEDDMTGLLRAAQGQWATVIIALNDESRDPSPMIRQLRALDRTRTTPVLIHAEAADARCVAALESGANDMVFANSSAEEIVKRVSALALRKSVLDALRADAAAIAPLSDFDHATGLPGPTQFLRTMPASLERLKAQGKPASLLLIAIDAPSSVPEGQATPDSVMLALTQVLRRSLRGFDYACRYSINCFAILMPGADANGAETVATRICDEIKSEKVRQLDGRKDGNTVSIGLATMPISGGAISAEQMIATALTALAKAQAQGAAQIVMQEFKLAA